MLVLERTCKFQPLVQKLGRLKRKAQDMGDLMDVLTWYAESDNPKDPPSDEEKYSKGKKNGGKGHQQNNGNG